jgi:radical SAM superfamily enzyme YgiQ (UPF0313 family)
MIERGLNASWTAQMRADMMTPHLVDGMHSAGCSTLYFGIESGSQKVLERINKTMNLEEAARGVKMTIDNAIAVKCSFIIGLPGSYEEQLCALDFIKATRPNFVPFHMLVPYPGTPVFNERQKWGIQIKQVDDWDSYQFYVPSRNIEYDYLPHADVSRLIEDLRLGLESLGYSSGHLSGHPDVPAALHMYSLPLID